MVCLRGESPTTHMNQMKLFNVIAAAAVIGTSFFTINPAEARAHCTTNRHGAGVCMEWLGGRKIKVLVDDKFNDTGYIMWVDCNSGNWRVRANTGYSRANLNHEARKACTLT